MKKILLIGVGLFLAFEGLVLAVTNQPRTLGSAAIQMQTVAQLRVLSSNTTGQIVYCSDCASSGGAGTICISTGAATNSFVLSTGTLCQ